MEIQVELRQDILGDWGDCAGTSVGWSYVHRKIDLTEMFSIMAREITRQEKKIAAFEAKFGEVEIEEVPY